MLATINGEQRDVPVALKRDNAQVEGEQLYLDDRRALHLTHSRSDEIPVIVQVDGDLLFEVEPRLFYTIDGMHYDWQPGVQTQSLTGM